MAKTKGVRPITRALNIVRLNMTDTGNGSSNLKDADRIELMNILHDMDASTGKPDKARKTKGKKKRT